MSNRRSAPGDFEELLAWLVRHGALDAAGADRRAALGAEHPEEAAAALAFAGSARQLLWRVFNELADQRTLSPALLDEVNRELVEALPRQRIVAAKVGFRWAWDLGGAEDLGRTLWPVIQSAAELLTSRYFGKVVRCAGEGCDLLFVRRKGGSPRRWCSMESCGKRVKSQRYYHDKLKPRRQKRNEEVRAANKELLRELEPLLAVAERRKR
jgi:predicted RNA-binding Zn ribbon-like protein